MGVTMATADAALKTIYLDVVRDQINTETAAVYNKIKRTNRNIQGGKSVVKLAPFGVNGGTGAGTETSALPASGGNKYVNFISGLKKLYGVIEISDMAVEASKFDQGSFVNLLKAEMEGLLKGAKCSFGRQIYLDGTGLLTATGTTNPASLTINVASTQYLEVGMIIDILDNAYAAVANGTQRRIASIPSTTTIILDGSATVATAATGWITEQGSYNNELTGFNKVFAGSGTLYGLDKANYSWLIPQLFAASGAISDRKIINAMMQINNKTGGKVDFLPCATNVYLEYYEYLEATKRNANTLDLKGGFTALSVNNQPLVQDRYIASGELYPLDTSQWTFHELNDWDWMQDQQGAVLKQVAGYPKWTATLRKYAEVICDHPGAQAKMSGITIT